MNYNENNKIMIFQKGLKILESVFGKFGYQYLPGDSGQSSGGWFVSAIFKKGNRVFHFSYRDSLGDIYYEKEPGHTLFPSF
jgi:hypothetical protein